ncbi:MAG: type II toxin-antitoxin system VapC family toxin [Pseudolabrys sp.]
MIGLDTNVILRCFVDDDPEQRQARQFVADNCTQENPGFVDRVALCEMIWVLVRGHRFDRSRAAEVVSRLMASSEIMLEDDEAVRAALRIFLETNIDFADALIGEVNRVRGCEATATFDRKAARLDGFVRVG